MSSPRVVMKRTLLLALLPAFLFSTSTFADVPKKKDAAAPEKKIEPKKKYAFIGKLWEKEKIEDNNKEEDKKAGDKKGKKDKKGKRSHGAPGRAASPSPLRGRAAAWLRAAGG